MRTKRSACSYVRVCHAVFILRSVIHNFSIPLGVPFLRAVDDIPYQMQFFARGSGARLSRSEFFNVMDMHAEISEFTTVSGIRQTGEAVRPCSNPPTPGTNLAFWRDGCCAAIQ